MKVKFSSTSGISTYGDGKVRYLGGNLDFPYTYKNGLFQYFVCRKNCYVLEMTSLKDLEVEHASND